ncbi:UNVERIFIED_CONTAM: hypothetical protein GTU68_032313 [Idotea baltica]|nr:hypothetical protein [Idotea baltica]
MPDSLLAVTNAHKAYGSHVALRGVTFDVRPGELLGLLGPNGAGKTTLIRAICGRHRLDQGSIQLSGEVLRRRHQLADLGFVPQDLAVYSDLTAQQNLEIFGRLHGVSSGDLHQRVNEALEWTQLAGRRNDLAGSFSGGMQRRLNIACGVLHDPRVLLLDEPTVGVDPQSRERIFEMLHDLRSKGTSIVLTTHQLDEAQSRCDRIVIIDQGKVIAAGTLNELIGETVGHSQRLTVFASRAESDETGTSVQTLQLMNVATQLPQVVSQATEQGFDIDQLTLEAPSLQDVFLHLTGRELRE